jgi:hypothetical protein
VSLVGCLAADEQNKGNCLAVVVSVSVDPRQALEFICILSMILSMAYAFVQKERVQTKNKTQFTLTHN